MYYIVEIMQHVLRKNINSSNRSDIFFLVIVTAIILLFMASPNLVLGQEGETNSTSNEETRKDPITLINEVRTLLNQTSNQYVDQDFDGAEETARIAYLEHYEYLEDPLDALDHELKETTEILMREDLIKAIEDRAEVSVVQDLINAININLDQAEVLFQK